jgi:hypothetical protein
MPVMMTSSGACGESCAMASAGFFPRRGGFPRVIFPRVVFPRVVFPRFWDADDFRGGMKWIVALRAA